MSQPRHLLHERLYVYVLDEIRKGALRSGDRVPSEKELARAHGVRIGFWRYFRVGAPLTLLTIVIGLWWL